MSLLPNKPYFFLGSPYKGNDQENEHRYHMSLKAVAFFLEKGISVFSPILYNQAVMASFDNIQPEERYKLLMPMNLDLLYPSQGLLLLKVEGWDTSRGVQEYINACKAKHIPIYEVEPDDMEKTLNVLLSRDMDNLEKNKVGSF